MLSSLPAAQTFCNTVITTTTMSASPDQAAAAAAHSFNKVLNQHKSSKSRRSGDADEGLKKLRRMILVEGIPSKADSALRPRVWKILLRVDDISAETFLQYVSRGPCEVREKIRNDTFR
jgi:cell cycle arrest protein BUB2